jgi:ribosomal protein S16
VRMTGNDDAYSGGAGLDIEFREIVDHVDEYVTHSDQLRLPEAHRPRSRIVVASDRNQRRQEGELIENLGFADISAMDDVVTADEKRARLGPEKSMSIRYKSNAQTVVQH